MMQWAILPQNNVFKFENNTHLATASTNRKKSQQGLQDQLLKGWKKMWQFSLGVYAFIFIKFLSGVGVALGKDLEVGLNSNFFFFLPVKCLQGISDWDPNSKPL